MDLSLSLGWTELVVPLMITVSPFSMNLRVKFSSNCRGLLPRQDNSNIDPKESGVAPLIVPVAIKSPARKLHPLIVW